MKSWTVSVITHLAGKKEVWELVADIDHWREWDFNIENSGYMDDIPKQGRSFSVKHRKFITAKGVVEESTPHVGFTIAIRLAGARMYRRYVMEDTQEGVKISLITSVSGYLGWLWRFLVVQRILRDTPEDLSIIVEQAKKKQL